jgi:Vitamin K-dependent gamma-carboxylase
MLLYTHSVWGSVLIEFLGPSSWNSPELVSQLRENNITPSLWWYVPEAWMYSVHWLCSLVILLFIVGLGGRFTALLTWAVAVSYAHRTSLANFGLDQTNCILALYLVIGPSTQYLSVDHWIAKRWFRKDENRDSHTASANVALRLIQLHLCIIYLWAGLGKLQGEAWWNGNAIWLAVANLEYQSMDLTWLANWPRLLDLLTHTTIFWELSFSALVWPKATRWIVLGVGVLMHLGIGAFLGMWTFGSIMIFSYVSFASGQWLRQSLFKMSDLSAGEQREGNPQQLDIAQTESPSLSVATQSVAVDDGSKIEIPQNDHSDSQVELTDSPLLVSHDKTVVLISSSQRCVDHFLQINRQAKVNWVVVSSIKEAESLVLPFRDSIFILLELRKLENSQLEYLSIRTFINKKNKRSRSQSESESQSKRAFPK